METTGWEIAFDDWEKAIKLALEPADLSPLPEHSLRCGDLFCGLGILSLAARQCGIEIAFAHEPDGAARKAYRDNFGKWPVAELPEKLDGIRRMPPLDLLFARTPRSPQEYDEVHGRVLSALRPPAVLLGTAAAPVDPLTADGKDDPTGEGGIAWAHLSGRMRELGYRVRRITFDCGTVDRLDPLGYRVIVGFLDGMPFDWEWIGISAKSHPAVTNPDAPGPERSYEGLALLSAVELKAAHLAGLAASGAFGSWQMPADSPDFAELVEGSLSVPLAESAVITVASHLIMARRLGRP